MFEALYSIWSTYGSFQAFFKIVIGWFFFLRSLGCKELVNQIQTYKEGTNERDMSRDIAYIREILGNLSLLTMSFRDASLRNNIFYSTKIRRLFFTCFCVRCQIIVLFKIFSMFEVGPSLNAYMIGCPWVVIFGTKSTHRIKWKNRIDLSFWCVVKDVIQISQGVEHHQSENWNICAYRSFFCDLSYIWALETDVNFAKNVLS